MIDLLIGWLIGVNPLENSEFAVRQCASCTPQCVILAQDAGTAHRVQQRDKLHHTHALVTALVDAHGILQVGILIQALCNLCQRNTSKT